MKIIFFDRTDGLSDTLEVSTTPIRSGAIVYFVTQGSYGAYLNAEQVGKLYDVLGVWVRENGTPATAPLWEEV